MQCSAWCLSLSHSASTTPAK
uniref:Uncharacterized protein n=1 Tax=Moniliophthora roreri TaxID=221103 RepID=A0A0W0FE31_MONRR